MNIEEKEQDREKMEMKEIKHLVIIFSLFLIGFAAVSYSVFKYKEFQREILEKKIEIIKYQHSVIALKTEIDSVNDQKNSLLKEVLTLRFRNSSLEIMHKIMESKIKNLEEELETYKKK